MAGRADCSIAGPDIVDAWTQKPWLIGRTNLAYRSRSAQASEQRWVSRCITCLVAKPRVRLWHRDRNYFDANDAILILSRYFGSLNVLFVCMLRLAFHK